MKQLKHQHEEYYIRQEETKCSQHRSSQLFPVLKNVSAYVSRPHITNLTLAVVLVVYVLLVASHCPCAQNTRDVCRDLQRVSVPARSRLGESVRCVLTPLAQTVFSVK